MSYLDRIKFWVRLNQIWIIFNPFELGTVPPGSAYQPAQPSGTMAMAHRSALPPWAPLSTWHGDTHARRSRAIAGRPKPPAATPAPPPSPSFSLLHMDIDHGPLPPFLYPPVAQFKRALPWSCRHPSPYFKPLPFSPSTVSSTRALLSPRSGGPSPPLSPPTVAGPRRHPSRPPDPTAASEHR
jgi:hypothetical protein